MKERIEYEKMKSEFEIEDEGEDVISEEEQNRQTQLFIDYIKGKFKTIFRFEFVRDYACTHKYSGIGYVNLKLSLPAQFLIRFF